MHHNLRKELDNWIRTETMWGWEYTTRFIFSLCQLERDFWLSVNSLEADLINSQLASIYIDCSSFTSLLWYGGDVWI
jgi:hypothetical protein